MAQNAVARLTLALAGTVVLATAGAAHPPDIADLGPRVGERVPGFSLVDQHGTERTLESLLGPKGLLLVFFRSADW